jgi:DNA-binding Xre family transcriptional regulator
MTKPMVRIVELDGTVIDREMNEDELAQLQIDIQASDAAQAEAQAKAAQKAALLERLGISEDEARLLLA